MKKIILTIVAIICVTVVFAKTDKNAAKYGFKMMDIPSSSAMLGSGFGGILYAKDVFSFGSNPAVALQNNVNKAEFSANSWLFDTVLSSAGIYRSYGKYGLGAQFRYLDYGKMEERLDNGEYIGDFEPLDMHIQINYAYRLNPDFYLGANFSLAYEKINTASSYALAGDLGLIYLTPLKGLKAGFALRNMGASSEMDSEKIDLPFRAETSFAYEKSINENLYLDTELNISQSVSDEAPKEVLSAGLTVFRHLIVRGGYMINYDENDYSLGFGVLWKRFNIDYAYVPSKISGEDSHAFGLSLKL
ncbi:MAG: hypothetical protein CSB55_02310 [Candidatus Cloacimonadota bacterium]|nr:MAG: hypothetical protein CSB55_02310 [Candidatus Cloacimonadota bacterium]